MRHYPNPILVWIFANIIFKKLNWNEHIAKLECRVGLNNNFQLRMNQFNYSQTFKLDFIYSCIIQSKSCYLTKHASFSPSCTL